jgi:hypothetical protein
MSKYDPGLIYDVGMNNGDDTAYYLRRGFRVVAIEPNPAAHPLLGVFNFLLRDRRYEDAAATPTAATISMPRQRLRSDRRRLRRPLLNCRVSGFVQSLRVSHSAVRPVLGRCSLGRYVGF